MGDIHSSRTEDAILGVGEAFSLTFLTFWGGYILKLCSVKTGLFLFRRKEIGAEFSNLVFHDMFSNKLSFFGEF